VAVERNEGAAVRRAREKVREAEAIMCMCSQIEMVSLLS